MPLDDFKRNDQRWILSCDGGGIRGIITLRCLEALEERLGSGCLEIFDMFAGTSTGAIIAGALASAQLGVSDLIKLYRERRKEIFDRSLLGFLHPLVTKYKKKPIHRLLRESLDDRTLEECPKDILITATDTVRSETIYFSAFHSRDASRYGTYKAVPLRHAIEASVSAPTYFPAHGRFVDGGVGVHNNPAYVAAVEALRYSYDKAQGQTSPYAESKVFVLSFSTGAQTGAMEAGEAMSTSSLGWAKYVLDEGLSQASYQQSYVCQRELDGAEHVVTFYRYEVFLTPSVLAMAGVTAFDPGRLTLDAIDDASFDVLDRIGAAFGSELKKNAFFIGSPQPPAAGHWERLGSPALPGNYLETILHEFWEIDQTLG